jgi:uncharacterized protein YcaQ
MPEKWELDHARGWEPWNWEPRETAFEVIFEGVVCTQALRRRELEVFNTTRNFEPPQTKETHSLWKEVWPTQPVVAQAVNRCIELFNTTRFLQTPRPKRSTGEPCE